jgi:hypothetical protein
MDVSGEALELVSVVVIVWDDVLVLSVLWLTVELEELVFEQPSANIDAASNSTASVAATARLSLMSSLPVVIVRSEERRDSGSRWGVATILRCRGRSGNPAHVSEC